MGLEFFSKYYSEFLIDIFRLQFLEKILIIFWKFLKVSIGRNITKNNKKQKSYFFTEISKGVTFSKQSLRENQELSFVFPSHKIIYKIRKLNPKRIYTFLCKF